MKKTTFILLIGLIITIIISGYYIINYETYSKEDLLNCREGKYSPNNDMEKVFDKNGMKVDYLEITTKDLTYRDGKTCDVEVVLKEPMMEMGTEYYTFLLYENCETPVMKQMKNSGRDITFGCG